MARPIKETPVLTGKDAKKFLDEKKKNQSRKEDSKTRERILDNYKKLQFA